MEEALSSIERSPQLPTTWRTSPTLSLAAFADFSQQIASQFAIENRQPCGHGAQDKSNDGDNPFTVSPH
jgi:hypothetical protein